MADETATTPATTTSVTTSAPVVSVETSGKEEMSAIMKILGAIAVICAFGIVGIGFLSVYLRLLDPPQEAGASVGAIRENLSALLGVIVGAFVMKVKGGNA